MPCAVVVGAARARARRRARGRLPRPVRWAKARVRAEDVVGVVAAHLQAAGRDDQPLAAGRRALTRAARRAAAYGATAARPVDSRRARRPARRDERPELVGGRAGAVLCLLLLLAHPAHGATRAAAADASGARPWSPRVASPHGSVRRRDAGRPVPQPLRPHRPPLRGAARRHGRRLGGRGVTREIFDGWEDDPARQFPQLRMLAGLFRIVLRGDAPQLEGFYPRLGGDFDHHEAWALVRPVLGAHAEELHAVAAGGPADQRAGCTVALLVGCRGGAPHRPAAGAAARAGGVGGLGLLVDHYRFVGRRLGGRAGGLAAGRRGVRCRAGSCPSRSRSSGGGAATSPRSTRPPPRVRPT